MRRARPDDAPAMAQLARHAYAPYVERIGREPAPMTDDYAAIIRNAEAWVAESSGRVVGLLVLRALDDHMLLDNLALTPEIHNLGVGRLLLDLADQRTRAVGLAEIRLYTNVAMIENLAYYTRHGYRESHRATQDGYERAFFTKSLRTR